MRLEQEGIDENLSMNNLKRDLSILIPLSSHLFSHLSIPLKGDVVSKPP
jgi:hypothetical protein